MEICKISKEHHGNFAKLDTLEKDKVNNINVTLNFKPC